MFCCYPTLVSPTVEPHKDRNIRIEAFAFHDGMIFVVKSEIVIVPSVVEVSGVVIKRKDVWVEIYIASGGCIVLYKTIRGRIIPAQPESFDFSEFKKEFNK